MTTLRKLLSRLLLVGLGIACPLLMIEGAVRLLHIAPPVDLQPPLWAPHPYMGWFHVPNRGGMVYSEYGEYQSSVHINARGLRDREIGYDNPSGAYRILVLGDSFAEALQVPLEATLAKQLEGLLSRPDHPVEVINGGVGGWGTDQEAIFYAVEGFRYQPRLVLLLFFPHNDVLNNYEPLEVARVHGEVQKPFFHLERGSLVAPPLPFTPPPAPKSRPAPLLTLGEWLNGNLATYRLATPYLRGVPLVLSALGPSGLLGGMAVFMANDPASSAAYDIYRVNRGPEWEEAWQLTEAIIRRLDSEVRAKGSQLAVVIIGAPEQIYPERWSAALMRNPELRTEQWDLDSPNARLSQMLEGAGIPYVDLLPIFREAASQPGASLLHYRQDGHWTPAGNRLAADAVASFLSRLPGVVH